MSNFGKSTFYGGIYAQDENKNTCETCDIKLNCKFHKITTWTEIVWDTVRKSYKKAILMADAAKIRLKRHIWSKQDIYLPVLVSAILLTLVFLSKTAFAKTIDATNNLPIEDTYKISLISTNLAESKTNVKLCSINGPSENEIAQKDAKVEDLKKKVAEIVKGTPMSAMVDAISDKPKPVAAFIVGIAMKESKFGVYSPHIGGRDCFNYWGLKAGGKTTAGGYSCFGSPDEAVSVVGKTIEKMVAKGVRTPAQAISWKCGSSCAGHGAENVRKWISDVAINFNKINS